jgi:hypothetical protein
MTQTARVLSLARKIRNLRAKRHPLKWREICVKFGILKADGAPDSGLAYMIAWKGLQPKKTTLVRIGLCRRKVVYVPRPVAPADAWWRGLSAEEKEGIHAEFGE